jgi:hypothetical protein
MSAARVTEPAIEGRELGAWLRQARAGDVFEYHRGLLGFDRSALGPLPSDAARDALNRRADLALRLAAEGRVHLLQRRLGVRVFSYLAVARAQTARHASLPQHLEVAR